MEVMATGTFSSMAISTQRWQNYPWKSVFSFNVPMATPFLLLLMMRKTIAAADFFGGFRVTPFGFVENKF